MRQQLYNKRTLRKYWATAVWLVLGIVLSCCPKNVHAAQTDSIIIGVRVAEDMPPEAITDLAAVPGITEGSVSLSWTAPDENVGTTLPQTPVSKYIIRYATFSVDSLSGDTTAWWMHSGVKSVTLESPGFPPQPAGNPETFVLGGLEPGVTYYFAVKSEDLSYNLSPIDTKANTPSQQANSVALVIKPQAPTLSIDLTQTTTTQIRWVLTDNAYNETGLYISTNALTTARITANLGPLAGTGSTAGYIETGLTINTPYTRYGEAYNLAGSSFSAAFTRYTMANPPASLAFISASTASIVLVWNSNGNPSGTMFFVERDENGNGFVQTGANLTTNTYTDTSPIEGSTLSYRAFARNGDSIATVFSNTVSVYIPRRDSTPPKVIAYSPASSVPGIMVSDVLVNAGITMTFSEYVNENSLTNAFQLKAIRNQLGVIINQNITGTLQLDGVTLTFRPSEPLKKNHTYEINLSTDVTDLAGNHMAEPFILQFRTILDHTVENMVYGSDGKTYVYLPPGALPKDAYIRMSLNPMQSPLGALSNTINEANDKERARKGEQYTPLSNSIREFQVLSVTGEDLSSSLQRPAEICLPYDDSDMDGFVFNNTFRIHERFLTAAYLNEGTKLWVVVPSSRVDTEKKTVHMRVPHFSVYAILPVDMNYVGAAYAYPVPFVPSQGHQKIIFTNLSMNASIRIYTISGKLVRKLEESDGDGQLDWDVKNDEGEDVFSGVYLYVIKSGSEKKTGKLAIIR